MDNDRNYTNLGATPEDLPIIEEGDLRDHSLNHPSVLMIRWEITSRRLSPLPEMPDDLMTSVRNFLMQCQLCAWLSDVYEHLPRITADEILTGVMKVSHPGLPRQSSNEGTADSGHVSEFALLWYMDSLAKVTPVEMEPARQEEIQRHLETCDGVCVTMHLAFEVTGRHLSLDEIEAGTLLG